MKGSDLLVSALENEGVERIFGVPGEETLDIVESLRNSRIKLILTRHEQPAAFMAATHGRLTGRPGVCLATLGPGALNLTTGAAYALLGAMPMVMITGQKGIMNRKQARFQVVDIVATMAPLTKMARQIVSAATIPSIVRDAFRLAQQERPGPRSSGTSRRHCRRKSAGDSARQAAPDRHCGRQPRGGRARGRADPESGAAARDAGCSGEPAAARRRAVGFRAPHADSVVNTQMGKGSVAGGSNLYMGTAALSERDYVHQAIDRADLIIAIGHDTVEKPPFIMGPKGPTVLHVGYLPATVEEVFFPHAELIGDVGPSLALLGRSAGGQVGECWRALAAAQRDSRAASPSGPTRAAFP